MSGEIGFSRTGTSSQQQSIPSGQGNDDSPKFDVDAAVAAGYSLEEIGQAAKFDVAGARQAGYSDDEIKQHLSGQPTSHSTNNIVQVDANIMPQSTDNQTTVPLQSTPVAGTGSESTSALVSPQDQGKFSKENVMQSITEHRNATQDYFTDPVTGEQRVSDRISGAIEPDYTVLPGALGLSFTQDAAIHAGTAGPEIISKLRALFHKTRPELADVPLTDAAKLIVARRPDISNAEIQAIVKDVPTTHQAFALAVKGGDINYVKQALNDAGDAERGLLTKLLKDYHNHATDVLGTPDVMGAMTKYSEMVDHTAAIDTGKLRPVPELLATSKKLLENFYLQPNQAQTAIVRLVNNLEANGGRMTLTEAVKKMPEVNALLMKARNHDERALLLKLKDGIDEAVSKLGNAEHKAMFDDARETYRTTFSNKEAIDIINKNSAEAGRGTDWTKAFRELKEANLNTPETMTAMRIVEAFDTKFGNTKTLTAMSKAQGTNLEAGGLLGVTSMMVNEVRNILASTAMKVGIHTNRGINIKIQKDIIKAIKSSNTELEFVNKIKANKVMPEETKAAVVKIFQLEYKPDAHQTGDVNLNPIVTPTKE